MAGPYATIEDVLNLARVVVNDTFQSGAGRIFVDTAPFIVPLLNNAIQSLQRDLEVGGVVTMIRETFITGITPVNGPAGLSVPDPAVQQKLSYDGFWDGSTTNASIQMPTDCLVPKQLWQRRSATTDQFTLVEECQSALMAVKQANTLGQWEWRQDQMYWNGSLIPMDIRIRYTGTVTFLECGCASSTFSTTTVPFQDCQDALAYRIAYLFCASRLPPGGADSLLAIYKQAVDGIIRRHIRRLQHVRYRREPFGQSGNLSGWFR